MTSPTPAELLGQLPFSARLSPAAVAKLTPLVVLRDFPAGAVLFEEGSVHPWVYLIAAGDVGLEMCIPARGCSRILTLGPGDLLVWSALLGTGRMTATAVALTPTRVLALPAQALRELCEQDHDFGYEWMRATAEALAKRLLATRLQLLDLYGPGAETATTARAASAAAPRR
jgi:CRP-like cAMP-binding protein